MILEDTRAPDLAGVVKGARIRAAAAWIALPLFFFATGGSLRWWEAWAYCLTLLLPMTAFVALVVRRDPEMLARRLKMKEQERSQQRIVAWGGLMLLAAFVVTGLDHRFGWSQPPFKAVAVALGVVLATYLMVLRVFVVNRWAGRTIEVYPGQELVTTGPYAVVRHPMYAAAIPLYLLSPVALGSWWGLLPAFLAVAMFVPRILNEEKVLARGLPGYEEYRRNVRYRLVPFVW